MLDRLNNEADQLSEQRRVQGYVEAFLRKQPPEMLAGATELARFLGAAIAIRVRAGEARSPRTRVYPWNLEAQCRAANARLAGRVAAAGTAGEARRVYENYVRQVSYRHLPIGADVLLGGGPGDWPGSGAGGQHLTRTAGLVQVLTGLELRTLDCRRKAEAAGPMFSWAAAAIPVATGADRGSGAPASSAGDGASGDGASGDLWREHWLRVESAWRDPLEWAWCGGLVRDAILQAYGPMIEFTAAMRVSADSSLSGPRLELSLCLLEKTTRAGGLLMAMVEVMDSATPSQLESVDVARAVEVLLATLPHRHEIEAVADYIQPLECVCSRCFTDAVGLR